MFQNTQSSRLAQNRDAETDAVGKRQQRFQKDARVYGSIFQMAKDSSVDLFIADDLASGMGASKKVFGVKDGENNHAYALGKSGLQQRGRSAIDNILTIRQF